MGHEKVPPVAVAAICRACWSLKEKNPRSLVEGLVQRHLLTFLLDMVSEDSGKPQASAWLLIAVAKMMGAQPALVDVFNRGELLGKAPAMLLASASLDDGTQNLTQSSRSNMAEAPGPKHWENGWNLKYQSNVKGGGGHIQNGHDFLTLGLGSSASFDHPTLFLSAIPIQMEQSRSLTSAPSISGAATNRPGLQWVEQLPWPRGTSAARPKCVGSGFHGPCGFGGRLLAAVAVAERRR